MGKQVDLFQQYVDHRLREWAREIRGGTTYLGFSDENHICMTPRGRMPPMSPLTIQTEEVVNEIRKESEECAKCLRAVYMGRGRWSEERRRDLERALGRKLTRKRFFMLFDDAFDRATQFFSVLVKIT